MHKRQYELEHSKKKRVNQLIFNFPSFYFPLVMLDERCVMSRLENPVVVI